MPSFARETGPKRLFAAALVVCSAAFAAGCSQTTGSVTPSASARSDFADSGQPILLNSGAAAGSQAGAATAQANAAPAQAVTTPAQGAQPANKKLAVIPLSPAAGGSASSGALATPRVATAVAPPQPAATDAISLVPADESPPADNPDAAAASAEAPAPAAETSGTEVIADGPAAGKEQISADAKAKLIGELEALKKRPGVAPAPAGNAAAAEGDAAAATDCADGSLDPQCAATE
jgi:hypothetical protein